LLQSHKNDGKEFEFPIATLGHVLNETQQYCEQKPLAFQTSDFILKSQLFPTALAIN
jgi:hypothetical protein